MKEWIMATIFVTSNLITILTVIMMKSGSMSVYSVVTIYVQTEQDSMCWILTRYQG